jgi:hypothetical protein
MLRTRLELGASRIEARSITGQYKQCEFLENKYGLKLQLIWDTEIKGYYLKGNIAASYD